MNKDIDTYSQTQVYQQSEKTQSENIVDITIALIKLQSQLEFASKDSSNPFFKSKYADLATVWATSIKLLTKYELAVVQTLDVIDAPYEEIHHKDGKIVDVKKCQKQNILVTNLIHSSGQWFRSKALLNTAKRDPQGEGSAITYMRRYAFCAILGIIQDDDDGERAMDRKKSIKELQYSEINKQDIKDKFIKFTESIQDDKELIIEYLMTYSNHYKLTACETIEKYESNIEKLILDSKKWKEKQSKKKETL